MIAPTNQGRHDRTYRFMQTAFAWDTAPSPAGLREAAETMTITIAARPDRHPGQRLPLLALANVLGRLPVPIRFALVDSPLDHTPSPFIGERVIDVLAHASPLLPGDVSIDGRPPDANLQMRIRSAAEASTWTITMNSWAAGLERGSTPWHDTHPGSVGAYLGACAAGGEVLRAWARHAAESRTGVPGSRFGARTRPAAPRMLDLGPTPDPLPDLPMTDWVSAGAVNQASLAVLAAQPDLRLQGQVVDPKELDPPDLNRSLLSLSLHIDRPKAEIAATSAGLDWQQGYYPEDIADQLASWIVTGTDDPRVRVRIQRAASGTILVTATEDVHGLSSWHRLGTPGPCAACELEEGNLPDEPLPTTAPTSAAAGVLTAARLLQLRAEHSVPREAVLSTLRLDDGVDHIQDSEPDEDCAVCRGGGLSAPSKG